MNRSRLKAICVMAPLMLAMSVAAQARHAPATAGMPTAAEAHWTWQSADNAAELPVRVVAEELPMLDAEGNVGASVFAASYLVPDAADRPVVFFWNGGPGGASIGLHTSFGPRAPDAAPKDPTQRASLDNPISPIDLADLVFVDAVGTGYSRVLRKDAEKEHWGIQQDASSAARFVTDWLHKHGREHSPVILVGQSYAGVRVPLAARMLLTHQPDINLRGIMLVSPSTGGPRPTQGDEAAAARRSWQRCATSLPVYVQTAAFHGVGSQVGRPVDEIAGEVESFVVARSSFSEADQDMVAAYTGLAETLVREHTGCVPADVFQKSLLAARGDRVGTSDTRLHAALALTETRSPPYNDPSTSPYTLNYDLTAAWEHFLRNEIGYQPRNEYVRLSLDANKAWDWSWPADAGSSTADVLQEIFQRKPGLKVLVAVGYYDLSVPYFAPAQTFAKAGLVDGHRFKLEHYRTGHAVHSDTDEQPRAHADLRALIKGTQ